MHASLSHIQVNVANAGESFPFYRDFLAQIGWEVVDESDEHIGATDGAVTLWLIQAGEKYASDPFHRKHAGLNHLAFVLGDAEEVDAFKKEFLDAQGIPTLYGSPKLFPEYGDGYYAVYFEGPDRIKIEVLSSS